MEMESVVLQPTVQREEPAALGAMRVFCKQNTDLNMAARGTKALLVTANPEDKSQHWFQRYDAGKLVDHTRSRAFVLVNRTTGEALVASLLPQIVNEVKLVPYSGHVALKTSMLWTQGEEFEDGFTEIRAFDAISQTLNGLGGNVSNRMVVGLCPTQPYHGNAIWKVEPIRTNNVV